MKISKFPKRIVVELSLDCNLDCSMCPRNHIDKNKGFMSRFLWEKIIEDINDNSPNSIVIPFWRGESLLHPYFTEIINFAFSKGLKMHFSTNGVIFNERIAAILSHFEFITFSVHNLIGYKNAKKFLLFKNDDNFPITQVSFVQGEETIKNIYDDLIQSKDLAGFDSVRLYEEHSIDGAFGRSSQTLDSNRNFCPKLHDTLVIAFDGCVSRCNHVWNTEKDINIANYSISEIWNSRRLSEIRNNYPDEVCLVCDQWLGHTRGESFRKVNNNILHYTFN
ncbi:MAG: SPASM domain-containing protein [Candidatus Omnitrophota bacterium]